MGSGQELKVVAGGERTVQSGFFRCRIRLFERRSHSLRFGRQQNRGPGGNPLAFRNHTGAEERCRRSGPQGPGAIEVSGFAARCLILSPEYPLPQNGSPRGADLRVIENRVMDWSADHSIFFKRLRFNLPRLRPASRCCRSPRRAASPGLPIGSKFIKAIATASVQTGFQPATITPGLQGAPP